MIAQVATLGEQHEELMESMDKVLPALGLEKSRKCALEVKGLAFFS